MNLKWLGKLKDSSLSALPVVLVVLVIYFTKLVEIPNNFLFVFLISVVFIIAGMWLFTLGAESAISKMGEYVGSSLGRKQKLSIFIIILILFGVFVTIAEPDLTVLAEQVPINKWLLIIMISVGVGLFLVIGALRILFKKDLRLWLLAFYGLLFALACLVDKQLLPLSFDSGGVTTGPITVPFILALGVGIAASRSGNNQNSDSFGLVAFSSVGPILMVMILALTMRNAGLTYHFEEPVEPNILTAFLHPFLNSLLNVFISLFPIVIFFLVYNFIFLKLTLKSLLKLGIGILYTYIGLVLFLTAVETGFMPIGKLLGIKLVAERSEMMPWMITLIGFVLGVAAIFAEPAVHVLTDQVDNISDGAIGKTTVLITLAISNGLAIGISILRMYVPGFELMHILVPGYILAFGLSFFVPKIYTAIAFDSGGVVSGPMNTTFILPYAIGACYALNGNDSSNIMIDAFGTIAVVALMPLISIQVIGLTASFRKAIAYNRSRKRIKGDFDDQIIHF